MLILEKKVEQKDRKNKKTGIILLAIIVCIGIVLAFAQCGESKKEMVGFGSGTKRSAFWINLVKPEYIAILQIEGVIEEANATYNQDWLLQKIESLKNDKKNIAMMIVIDSPGGSVYQSDEAYLALKSYANEKPLYAYFKSLAASGGYYISCAAEHIIANRNTLTGSIGVISGSSIDLTEMLEKFGIKITTFHSGANKNMLNYNEVLTDEQREIMQSISDECYEQFTQIVSQERNLSLSKVKKLSDGRVYTAAQALDLQLIDAIASFDDALLSIQNNINVSTDTHKEYFSYQKKKTFLESMLDVKSQFLKNTNEAEFILQLIESPIPFPAYYYAP